MNINWFTTKKISDNIYLTREEYFFEGNRCNIWLIKGPAKDVIIDTGLGVRDLKLHFETEGLLEPVGSREVIVILTHVHFDHSGGAHHFEQVYIHDNDRQGLLQGRQTETLNYVKPSHFLELPSRSFNACNYRVPPTGCNGLRDREHIDIGGGEYLEVLHVPGHTKGSICIHYPAKKALFSGDFVYDCGYGGSLIDWLPASCVRDYSNSANVMTDWLSCHDITNVYPGHFRTMNSQRVVNVLQEYMEAKENCCGRGCTSCLQCSTWVFFMFGCFRCCPCG